MALATGTKIRYAFAELRETVEDLYEPYLASQVMDLFLDADTWWIDRELSNEDILRQTCETFNRLHPDDEEWYYDPLNVKARKAYNYSISVLRHEFSEYDWILWKIKNEITYQRRLEDCLVQAIRKVLKIFFREAYPQLWDFIHTKYLEDNYFGDGGNEYSEYHYDENCDDENEDELPDIEHEN